ncbi:hypothetical protein ACQ4PT_005643 [Festuca glaucescens]
MDNGESDRPPWLATRERRRASLLVAGGRRHPAPTSISPSLNLCVYGNRRSERCPTQGSAAAAAGGDWRAQLQPEERSRIVSKSFYRLLFLV